jgi:hypothetical protein
MPIRGRVQHFLAPPPVTIRAVPRGVAGQRNEKQAWRAMLADRDSLLRRLHELRSEHRDLDTVITRLSESGADALQLQRLKKRKLKLKDEIAWLESRLVPDIIA